MRRGQTDEFSGRYDFGFLPEFREMLLIARDQIVRAGNIGTFQKHIVVRVARNFKARRGTPEMTVVFYKLQQLLSKTLANLKFGTGKHITVFLKDWRGDVQSRRFSNGKQQHGALQPGGFNGSGN